MALPNKDQLIALGLSSGATPFVQVEAKYNATRPDRSYQAQPFIGAETPLVVTGRLKVWNGSAWVIKPVKYWPGSAWVEKPLKFWNGSSWL